MKSGNFGRRSWHAALALAALVCCALIGPVLLSGLRPPNTFSGSVSASTGDVVPVASPIQLSSSPKVILERGTVSIASARKTAGPGASALSLLVGRRADVVLSDASITIYQPGAEGTDATVDPGKALSAILVAIAKFEFRTLELKRVAIELRRPGDEAGVILHVSASVTHGLNREIVTKGTLAYHGDDVAFDVAVMRPGNGSADSMPIRASIKGQYVDATLDGRLALGERLQLKAPDARLKVGSLRETAQWLGQLWPSGPGLGPFSAQGLFVADSATASFENAMFTIDGNMARGALALSLVTERPSIEGTLAFEELDVASFISRKSNSALTLGDWVASLRFPGAASPSLIREVDSDIRISAKSVAVGSMKLGRFAASIATKDGRLSGEVAELELESGGNGQGRWKVDMTGSVPRYDVSTSLSGIDFGRLAARLGQTVLEGSGNLVAELSGHGATDADVLSSLSGKVELNMAEGGRLGIDTEALPASPAEEVSMRSLAASSTWVDRVVARVSAENGIFRADCLEAWTREHRLVGEGSVNIPDREIDMTLSVSPAGAGAKASAIVGGSAATEYRVSGPLSAPAVTAVKDTTKPVEPSSEVAPSDPKVPG